MVIGRREREGALVSVQWEGLLLMWYDSGIQWNLYNADTIGAI